jgi:pimeloyl-ACP methyl ester carboxylesterase
MNLSIASKDGNPIGFTRTGAGSPLILIHGTGASSARWKPVLAALEARFTIYAMDRRGRGGSPDVQPYAMAREFEDVAALVDSIGGPVDVIGHSFGGICAVEASLLTKNLRRLVLYEPPIPVAGHQIYSDEDVARLEAFERAGDREGILTAFFRGYVRVPPREFELLRAAPSWPARLAAAHTIPRELSAHAVYRFEGEKFAAMRTPTLILQGGDSPEFFKAAVATVHAALPESRVAVLPGQQHVAMDSAPELFLKEVLAFLA